MTRSQADALLAERGWRLIETQVDNQPLYLVLDQHNEPRGVGSTWRQAFGMATGEPPF